MLVDLSSFFKVIQMHKKKIHKTSKIQLRMLIQDLMKSLIKSIEVEIQVEVSPSANTASVLLRKIINSSNNILQLIVHRQPTSRILRGSKKWMKEFNN